MCSAGVIVFLLAEQHVVVLVFETAGHDTLGAFGDHGGAALFRHVRTISTTVGWFNGAAYEGA